MSTSTGWPRLRSRLVSRAVSVGCIENRCSVRPLVGSAMIEPPATITGSVWPIASRAPRDSGSPRPVQIATSMPA
ncbi:MAG: hypothetical protein IPJ41_04205 [Phycisphaerales bacterium]|nr:hypothetical protein [Phycisphaerales bacterium]